MAFAVADYGLCEQEVAPVREATDYTTLGENEGAGCTGDAVGFVRGCGWRKRRGGWVGKVLFNFLVVALPYLRVGGELGT